MNKSIIQLSFVLGFAVFACIACKNDENNIIAVEQLNYTEKYNLSDDSLQGVFTLSIQIELPVLSSSKAADDIRSFLVSTIFSDNYIQYDNKSILSMFADELKQDYKATNEPMLQEIADVEHIYSFNNDYMLEGVSLLNDENIFSYGFDQYVYMGGAHGLNVLSYYNFDTKTARRITEQDLFADGYEPAITELIKQYIVENNEQINTLEDLEQSDFWVDSIKPNGNFFISDEAITYVFNPYEIAPHYIGHTEVSLPYASIAHLLKPNSPVNYLLKAE